MLNRLFGKPKQEASNALTTLDKLNEVYLVNLVPWFSQLCELLSFDGISC